MSDLSDISKQWLEKAKRRLNHIDIGLLTRACAFSESLNEKAFTRFANNVLEQGLAMADELLELNADNESLATAITYPAVYYGQVDHSTIEKQLGKAIQKLLANAQRIESIQPMLQATSKKKIDNLRKMLLALVDDVRIVLIKLAECLVILKYLRKNDIPEKKAIAQQTSDIYAPLANRLGIGQLKWQLEDLAFRFSHEAQYLEIKKALKMRRSEREQYISRMIDELSKLFKKEGIENLSISGRAKHIFSIYRKMQKKHLSFKQLYDTIAFRILVPKLEDCYTVLSIVHSQWPYIQTEFDDYIAKPKPNGYQSIHTAVIGPHNMNIEIQIRTNQMHDDAELGIASHWKYKEGGRQSTYEDKINRLREIMAWQKEETAQENDENLYSKIFEDHIYVFTPNGDIFELSISATPLDFAYHLHTEVGHRCRGAKVNDILVPLTHPLKTGDHVEIITTKTSKPSRDWLNVNAGYLTTHHARQKVRHWFRKTNYEHDREEGSTMWEKHCRRAGLKKSEIDKAYQHFNCKSPDDLLASIGRHDIGMSTIVNYLKDEEPTTSNKSSDITISKQAAIEKTAKSGLVIEGVDNLLTSIARCCKPIPGDPITGYITQGRGITIHHQQCRNIQQAIHNQSKRIIEVSWGSQKTKIYPVSIVIEADDRAGLLRDISACITNEKIHIIGIQSHVDRIKNCAYISLTIEISSLDLLEKLLSQVRKVSSIMSAKRIQ